MLTVNAKRRSPDPLKFDPSRTLGLRRSYAAEFVRRLEKLRGDIVRLLVLEDAFGLDQPVFNVRWKFATSEQQIRAFQTWLEGQIKKQLLTTDEVDRVWTQRYINAAYKQGIVRGDTQTAKLRRKQFGSFLRDTAKQQRKVKLLVRRSLNEVEGLTNRLKLNAARIVADGLANGKTKRQIAKELSDQLGIEKKRARTIARTEVVRAQAEGQLDAFEEGGVTHVGALVEWVTRAGRGASEGEMEAAGVCPKCRAMNGVILSLNEARGLIPRHPNCYCAWFPALDTPDPDEKRTKRQIERAVVRSSRNDKSSGWVGTQKTFKSKTRKAGKRR